MYFLMACNVAFMLTDDKVVRSGNCTFFFIYIEEYVSVFWGVNGVLYLQLRKVSFRRLTIKYGMFRS